MTRNDVTTSTRVPNPHAAFAPGAVMSALAGVGQGGNGDDGEFYHEGRGVYTTVTRVQELPDSPDAQVAATVAVMAQYAVEDSASPEVQAQAVQALRESGGDPDDYGDDAAVRAVWTYVKSRMSFVNDAVLGAPVEERLGQPVVESVMRPRDIASWGVGDCDDYTTWGAALLLSMRVACRFATVAADARVPSEYSHIYLVAYPVVDGETRRVPMDLSHGKSIGWETENRFDKFREWDLESSAAGSGAGLLAIVAAVGVGLWQHMRNRRAA